MSGPRENKTDGTDPSTITDRISDDSTNAESLPPAVNTDETKHLKIEVSANTYHLWRKAVIKKHGKYREAHSIEGEKALRSHANAILDESDPSNAEIMQKLEELEEVVHQEGSAPLASASRTPHVTQKISSGESQTPVSNPGDPLVYDEIGAPKAEDIQWEKFANEYNHDVRIDPGAVEDWDAVVKQRKKYRVPVTLGFINYRREYEELEWIKESELTKWLQSVWGWNSRQSAYRHRDRLVDHGILAPSPWLRFGDEDDPENEEIVNRMKQGMASQGHTVESVDELTNREQDRWPGIRDVIKHVSPTLISVRYYVDDAAYAREVWTDITDSILQLDDSAKTNNRRNTAVRDATPLNKVRAFVPFLERIVREWSERVIGEYKWPVTEVQSVIEVAVNKDDELTYLHLNESCELVEAVVWSKAISGVGEGNPESQFIRLVSTADSTEELLRYEPSADSAEEVIRNAREIVGDWNMEEVEPTKQVLVEVLDEIAQDIRSDNPDARLASRPSEAGRLFEKRIVKDDD